MRFDPVIKWSGSKRGQSEKIVSYFPKNIDIYYEPFCGSCAVLYQLLNSKDIKVNRYICSDINNDLIELWRLIQKYPDKLYEDYKIRWSELNDLSNINLKNNYYYLTRDNFNKTKNPYLFYFLTRTCFNGLIRYNSKNEFNSPFHFSRPGINPNKLKNIIFQWSNKIQDVEFKCCSYGEIQGDKGDFIYCDPPYFNVKSMYYGKIDYNEYFNWLRKQKCNYILSFDGISGDNKCTYVYNVPRDIYDKHIFMDKEISSFRKLNNEKIYIRELLYIK